MCGHDSNMGRPESNPVANQVHTQNLHLENTDESLKNTPTTAISGLKGKTRVSGAI